MLHRLLRDAIGLYYVYGGRHYTECHLIYDYAFKCGVFFFFFCLTLIAPNKTNPTRAYVIYICSVYILRVQHIQLHMRIVIKFIAAFE